MISRIFLDPGLMQTRLAPVRIGAALIEDVAVYAVLAIMLGLVLDGTDGSGPLAVLNVGAGSVIASA